ncbi:hypothetical protein Pcinc_002197, partial [Petrolisthes cinctipes]
MILACVTAYTLAWLPFNLYTVVKDLPSSVLQDLSYDAHITLFFVVHCLAMSHTCYNPFIYFWMNSRFRNGFYYALGCLPCLPSRLPHHRPTSPSQSELRFGNNTKLIDEGAVNEEIQLRDLMQVAVE